MYLAQTSTSIASFPMLTLSAVSTFTSNFGRTEGKTSFCCWCFCLLMIALKNCSLPYFSTLNLLLIRFPLIQTETPYSPSRASALRGKESCSILPLEVAFSHCPIRFWRESWTTPVRGKWAGIWCLLPEVRGIQKHQYERFPDPYQKFNDVVLEKRKERNVWFFTL